MAIMLSFTRMNPIGPSVGILTCDNPFFVPLRRVSLFMFWVESAVWELRGQPDISS